jgi:hypothetical protein
MTTLVYLGNNFSFLDLLPIIIYFGFIITLAYLIFKWATKSMSLKKENNELLREIIRRLDNKKE